MLESQQLSVMYYPLALLRARALALIHSHSTSFRRSQFPFFAHILCSEMSEQQCRAIRYTILQKCDMLFDDGWANGNERMHGCDGKLGFISTSILHFASPETNRNFDIMVYFIFTRLHLLVLVRSGYCVSSPKGQHRGVAPHRRLATDADG